MRKEYTVSETFERFVLATILLGFAFFLVVMVNVGFGIEWSREHTLVIGILCAGYGFLTGTITARTNWSDPGEYEEDGEVA